MTDAARRRFALRFRALLDACVPRKMALLKVRDEIRMLSPDLPNCRASIYSWCRKFGISTR